jgi:hypothetical protein
VFGPALNAGRFRARRRESQEINPVSEGDRP